MRNLANFLLFQAAWLGTVALAARGLPWTATLPMGAALLVHLALEERRARELLVVALVGALGTGLDALLAALDVTAYAGPPAAGWPAVLPPPWIGALWAGFATLSGRSLSWLAPHPLLAALLGAAGGPLAYAGGERLGAVSSDPAPLLTWVGLALEYAAATPLLLRLHLTVVGPPAGSALRD